MGKIMNRSFNVYTRLIGVNKKHFILTDGSFIESKENLLEIVELIKLMKKTRLKEEIIIINFAVVHDIEIGSVPIWYNELSKNEKESFFHLLSK